MDSTINRPKDDSPEEIGFTRRKMVDWFRPSLLAATGIKVMLSSIFGSYADKRELMAVAAAPDASDYSDKDELWLDYTADLGDGFDSSYTVARMLSEKNLKVDEGGGNVELPAGRILVLGGDQIYPVATRDEYGDRFVGPYTAALPWVHAEEDRPHLFAIPGNHDWYDGLTSFTRLFCQQRGIGGWLTRQSRSYFAIRLPHGWWLWGLDIQLESDVDQPQIHYFEKVAKERMQPGDRVILCTPEPSWVYAAEGSTAANQNLEFIRCKIVEANQGTVPLMLAGDLHHYCRYESESGSINRITCGGGGAFLHGTHNLPEEFDCGGEKQERKEVYPDAKTSWKLVWRNALFPFINLRYAFLFLAPIYLIYAWFLESASIALGKTGFTEEAAGGALSRSQSFMEQIHRHEFNVDGIQATIASFFKVLAHSPINVLFLCIFIGGMVAFVEAPAGKKLIRWAAGGAHALAHLVLNIGLIWGFAWINLGVYRWDITSPWQTLAFTIEMLLAGGLCGGLLTGFYLIATNLFLRLNRTPALSSLRIPDYKSFLRIHITSEGLAIYPLAIRKVPRRWRFVPDADCSLPWFEPEDRPLEARLIEAPIKIPGQRQEQSQQKRAA